MTNKGQENKGSKKSVVNSSSGARRSRRLRQIEDFEEKRRFTISKSTTVKDIKVMVCLDLYPTRKTHREATFNWMTGTRRV